MPLMIHPEEMFDSKNVSGQPVDPKSDVDLEAASSKSDHGNNTEKLPRSAAELYLKEVEDNPSEEAEPETTEPTVRLSALPKESANNTGIEYVSVPSSSSDFSYQSDVEYPKIGETYLGFRILRKLGRGGFARVYLAQHVHLADLPVALKISSLQTREAQKLARLRHPNIMPIHSVFQAPPLQTVCMPYLGKDTLQDVISILYRTQSADTLNYPASGTALFPDRVETATTLRNAADETISSPFRSKQADSWIKSASVRAKSVLFEKPENDFDPQQFQRNAEKTFREKLSQYSFVEAVLILGERLADALDHAHGRGIIHRDIKPANILLSVEGQPLLMDFNLAVDFYSKDVEELGGTAPYMSPEQIRGMQFPDRFPLSASTDLFSLGVVLYELLTGQLPYPVIKLEGGRRPYDLVAMEAARRIPPAPASSCNPQVPPSVDAILFKLLEYDPQDRYGCAAELREDLQRQLQKLPLKYTREPSLLTYAGKLVARNPRTLIWSVVASLAIFFSLGYIRQQKQDLANRKLLAYQQFQTSVQQLKQIRWLVPSEDWPIIQQQKLIDSTVQILNEYKLLDNERWEQEDSFALLEPSYQAELRSLLGESLLQLAQREQRKGSPKSLELASELNQRAELCYTTERMPDFGWRQRLELAEARKNPTEANDSRAKLRTRGDQRVEDGFLRGVESLEKQRLVAAQQEFQIYAQRNPTSPEAHFYLGLTYQQQNLMEKAIERYRMADSLQPGNTRILAQRAMTNLNLRKYSAAIEDIDEAIQQDGQNPNLWLIKSQVFCRAQKFDLAEKALNEARKFGASEIRYSHVYVRLLQQQGKTEEALKVQKQMYRMPAEDSNDYIYRAMARVEAQPAEALEDVKQALLLAPNSIPARYNLACIYANGLKDTDSAIRELRKLMADQPEFLPARASLAVLLAKENKRAEAHLLAEKIAAETSDNKLVYQLAGVYALTGELSMGKHPEDTEEALRLLTKAISMGWTNPNHTAGDPNLKSLRENAEFQGILRSLIQMNRWAKPGGEI